MTKYLDEDGLKVLITNIKTALKGKQDKLASGTNIKTVNGQSLLGSGDITISGGSGDITAAGNNVFTGKNLFQGGVSLGTEDRYVTIAAANLSTSGSTPIIDFRESETNQPVVLRNIAQPSSDEDAANKKYVDDQIAAKLEAALTQLQSI